MTAIRIFFVILLVVVSFFFGWVYAHNVVAQECRYLNGFYVGKSIFECGEVLHYNNTMNHSSVDRLWFRLYNDSVR